MDRAFALALLLCGLAGWVDAVGVTQTGGVFLSFMSGNTTDFASSLVHHDWPKAGMIGAVLVLFVAGVIVGELLEPVCGRFGASVVLGLEAIVIAGAALPQVTGLPPTLTPYQSLPLVFAMGLQNATMHRAGGIGIGLTYVTGTLVQVGRAVADMVRRNRGGRRAAEHMALWLSLACGAGLGTLALSLSRLAALVLAACVAGWLAVAITRAS